MAAKPPHMPILQRRHLLMRWTCLVHLWRFDARFYVIRMSLIANTSKRHLAGGTNLAPWKDYRMSWYTFGYPNAYVITWRDLVDAGVAAPERGVWRQ